MRKPQFSDFWNRSWLQFFSGLVVSFHSLPNKTITVTDTQGFIPSHSTWYELAWHINAYYATASPEEIDVYNWSLLTGAPRSNKTASPPASPKPTNGYVYLLKGGPGPYYKIGRTTVLTERIATITPHLPFETNLVFSIATPDMFSLETSLHKKFAEKRTNGEWFLLNESDVEYIKGLEE